VVEIVPAARKEAHHGAGIAVLGGALLLQARDGRIALRQRLARGLHRIGDFFDLD
jgi:hypothetical protein